jgi:flagellar basal-body rod modification protein FlgD
MSMNALAPTPIDNPAKADAADQAHAPVHAANESATSTHAADATHAGTPDKPAVSTLFTTLLVAQIKNQDPLAPTDSAAFVNQLSQLSQVESMQALSSQTTANNHILSSMQAMSLGSQVGSLAQVQVSQLHLDDKPVKGAFTLPAATPKAALVLTGADGVAHRVELGKLDAGAHDQAIDPKALGLRAGLYEVHIENDAQQSIPLEVVAPVTGVHLAGDAGAMVQLGDLGEFSSQAITQFKGRAPATAHF